MTSDEPTPATAPPLSLSPAAHDLIVEFEVGGRSGYNQHPEWPGIGSGVTFGIGYDAGFHSAQGVIRDWGRLLDKMTVNALARIAGIRGHDAQLALARVKSLIIPWTAAMSLYSATTIPEEMAKTATAFPGSATLPADAFGALVSLVFNRGEGMEDHIGGRSRRHMRAIRDAIRAWTEAGSTKEALPGLLRHIAAFLTDMIVLWEGTEDYRGLKRRRMAEAALVLNSIPK